MNTEYEAYMQRGTLTNRCPLPESIDATSPLAVKAWASNRSSYLGPGATLLIYEIGGGPDAIAAYEAGREIAPPKTEHSGWNAVEEAAQ